MGKFYKRETVVYKFKHDLLFKDEFRDLTEHQRELLWKAFLLTLYRIRKVSRHQANTWVYPKKELTNTLLDGL